MLNDSEKILEYSNSLSYKLREIFENGEYDQTLLLDSLQLIGRILSRAYAINRHLVKEQEAQIDEYKQDIKRKFDEHDCSDADGCTICEEYFYSKGWDGLAHFAAPKYKRENK